MTRPFQPSHLETTNFTGQTQLPVSFSVAKASTSLERTVLSLSNAKNSNPHALVHILAKTVLQMPIFLGKDLMVLGFKHVEVFNVELSCGILEGIETMPLLHMAQVVPKVVVFLRFF